MWCCMHSQTLNCQTPWAVLQYMCMMCSAMILLRSCTFQWSMNQFVSTKLQSPTVYYIHFARCFVWSSVLVRIVNSHDKPVPPSCNFGDTLVKKIVNKSWPYPTIASDRELCHIYLIDIHHSANSWWPPGYSWDPQRWLVVWETHTSYWTPEVWACSWSWSVVWAPCESPEAACDLVDCQPQLRAAALSHSLPDRWCWVNWSHVEYTA